MSATRPIIVTREYALSHDLTPLLGSPYIGITIAACIFCGGLLIAISVLLGMKRWGFNAGYDFRAPIFAIGVMYVWRGWAIYKTGIISQSAFLTITVQTLCVFLIFSAVMRLAFHRLRAQALAQKDNEVAADSDKLTRHLDERLDQIEATAAQSVEAAQAASAKLAASPLLQPVPRHALDHLALTDPKLRSRYSDGGEWVGDPDGGGDGGD